MQSDNNHLHSSPSKKASNRRDKCDKKNVLPGSARIWQHWVRIQLSKGGSPPPTATLIYLFVFAGPLDGIFRAEASRGLRLYLWNTDAQTGPWGGNPATRIYGPCRLAGPRRLLQVTRPVVNPKAARPAHVFIELLHKITHTGLYHVYFVSLTTMWILRV